MSAPTIPASLPEAPPSSPGATPRDGGVAPVAGMVVDDATADASVSSEAYRRDRLLGGIALILAVGLALALPFALRAGAEFFLPVTASLVIAIALVPMLEWFERRGIPSGLAALLCLAFFLIVVNAAIAAIVVPATGWFALLPDRIGQIRGNLRPLIEIYANVERFIDDAMRSFARAPHATGVRTVAEAPPTSLLDFVASSAPHAALQMVFGVLVVYFFLAGWTRLRRSAIQNRSNFSSAMATARVIQEVVHSTSTYLSTITLINALLGLLVAGALYWLGLPTPLMWGGLVALLNYVPYLGPIVGAFLLAVGGLMTFNDVGTALAAPAIFLAAHLVEANIITPLLVGRRLTINPLAILVALSFWGWVWGTLGALLAVPLLIICKTVIDAIGKPDIASFLFQEGTLATSDGGRRKP